MSIGGIDIMKIHMMNILSKDDYDHSDCFVIIMILVVALAPLFGWKDDAWEERVNQGDCIVSNLSSVFLFVLVLVNQGECIVRILLFISFVLV